MGSVGQRLRRRAGEGLNAQWSQHGPATHTGVASGPRPRAAPTCVRYRDGCSQHSNTPCANGQASPRRQQPFCDAHAGQGWRVGGSQPLARACHATATTCTQLQGGPCLQAPGPRHRTCVGGWSAAVPCCLTLRNSGQAVPLYRNLRGSRRLAFSPGWAKGHCVQSWGLALGHRLTCRVHERAGSGVPHAVARMAGHARADQASP